MVRRLTVTHEPSGRVLGDRIGLADRYLSRLRGLMFRRRLAPGEGLLIRPCSSIHMMFMGVAIDAVFLAEDGQVLKVARGLRPWIGIASARGAREVLELPAGAADGIQAGDRLVVTSDH
ncbi:DUF192 domain-containing protein [Tepidiforma sp.]|uniref:DUF192 domain-containing protein n=1 Tax=Tepidiforma sp. TaxID=2682230 RepID=UPI002ADD7306|nr:DUF192 domain-containing protein [Tepidiforma sp.]